MGVSGDKDRVGGTYIDKSSLMRTSNDKSKFRKTVQGNNFSFNYDVKSNIQVTRKTIGGSKLAIEAGSFRGSMTHFNK